MIFSDQNSEKKKKKSAVICWIQLNDKDILCKNIKKNLHRLELNVAVSYSKPALDEHPKEKVSVY